MGIGHYFHSNVLKNMLLEVLIDILKGGEGSW